MCRTALATAALLALAASAQAQTPAAAPAGAASAPGAAAARPPADPTAPKPFADVIKGAKEQPSPTLSASVACTPARCWATSWPSGAASATMCS
ncbi:MAG: hypothetical protein HY020_01785 [Burkholderiales bacterium]|nr:hypothetical protein [Burkholderiales bacterium]